MLYLCISFQVRYRKSPAELRALRDELHRMLKLRIVAPSKSDWGTPYILIRKPEENCVAQNPRLVVNYCGLNSVTKGDKYPIPSITKILYALGEVKVYGKFYLASSYWQIPLHQQHQHKTAFVTH